MRKQNNKEISSVARIVTSGPRERRDMQGYLDETGLLHNQDRFFGLGLLVSPNVNHLHRQLIRLRNRLRYHHEFKFTNITAQNVFYYKKLVDEFFTVPHSAFSCLIHDKRKFDMSAIYRGNNNRAYNSSSGKLIADTLKMCEGKTTDYLVLLADDVSTAKADRFEKEIRAKVKKIMRRHAITSIIRLESHAVTEIQLVDVLLGAVAFAYKVDSGEIRNPNRAKLQLVKHIQKQVRVPAIAVPLERRVRGGVRFKISEASPN